MANVPRGGRLRSDRSMEGNTDVSRFDGAAKHVSRRCLRAEKLVSSKGVLFADDAVLQSSVKRVLRTSVTNVERRRRGAQLALRTIVGVTKASRQAGRAIVSVSSRKIVSKL